MGTTVISIPTPCGVGTELGTLVDWNVGLCCICLLLSLVGAEGFEPDLGPPTKTRIFCDLGAKQERA